MAHHQSAHPTSSGQKTISIKSISFITHNISFLLKIVTKPFKHISKITLSPKQKIPLTLVESIYILQIIIYISTREK